MLFKKKSIKSSRGHVRSSLVFCQIFIRHQTLICRKTTKIIMIGYFLVFKIPPSSFIFNPLTPFIFLHPRSTIESQPRLTADLSSTTQPCFWQLSLPSSRQVLLLPPSPLLVFLSLAFHVSSHLSFPPIAFPTLNRHWKPK